MKLLEAKNIKKNFPIDLSGGRLVLKDVNFSINEGEFTCITGKSGEGKTTLLKILAGIIKPTSGSIFFHNQKVTFFKKNRYRKKLSFIFQDYKLIPHLNIFENIALPLRIRNIPEWKKTTLEAMEFVGIQHLIRQYPYQISGGESQRASIARALSIKPDIIIADEPTGNLDSETEKEILKVFMDINKELNKTFIIVTHEEDIIQISKKHYKLAGGYVNEVH